MTIGEWIKIQPRGQLYSARTGHECIAHRQKIYLFGGTDDDDRKNDLYSYDIKQNLWEKLPQDSLDGSPAPLARSGAKGVYYQDKLFYYGGYQKKSGDFYNDIFAYNLHLRRWESIEPHGQCPSARTDHSCVLYEGSMYIFGGYDGKIRYGDLYKCNLKTYKWK